MVNFLKPALVREMASSAQINWTSWSSQTPKPLFWFDSKISCMDFRCESGFRAHFKAIFLEGWFILKVNNDMMNAGSERSILAQQSCIWRFCKWTLKLTQNLGLQIKSEIKSIWTNFMTISE